MLDKFMQEMANELEFEERFSTEVPGVYAFPIDEDLSITISEIPRGFTMTCSFSERPVEGQEDFYTHALTANLFGHGTEGCTLGLDAEGKKLVLSREVDYTIDYKEFRDMIEDFLNSVEFWREESRAYGVKPE